MGGNALKNIETRRYDLDEYLRISDLVLNGLRSLNSVTRTSAIRSYESKETFGDLDVLYSRDPDNKPMVECIRELFSPDEIVPNGPVISFNVEQLQVDLIQVSESQFVYADSYFAYNDLGNLVGKLAHKFGLKHGHAGLYLPVRSEHHISGNVLLTLDHDRTLKFLGLDPSIFHSGFQTLDDIFRYVSSSPHYNPAFYELAHLNAIARIRDKKRSTYRAFLKYGEAWTGPVSEMLSDKREYLETIFAFFPEALPEYIRVIEHREFNNQVATKFNGKMVAEITGLTGPELGKFIAKLRGLWWFSGHQLIGRDSDEIQDKIRTEYCRTAV